MIKKGWEHYSHTADMGIRGFGETKEDAFAQAALAMIATSIDPQTIRCDRQLEIACEGDDDELLFIAWLNRILYEMDARKMAFGRFEVAISGNSLTGRLWGEKLNSKKHRPVVEIKGATYSDLKVRQDKNGMWMAQCVVDI